MNYRRLTAADLEAVAEIETAVQLDAWSRAQILAVADLAHYQGWVAVLDDAIVGYIIVQNVVDAFEVLTIGVAKSHQGRGIGGQLWQHAWADMREMQPNINRCFLEVRASNHAAQALYARCGFTQIANRRNYYQNPREDAFILQKSDD